MKIGGSVDSYSIKSSYLGNCATQYKQGDALICAKDMPVSIEQAVMTCDTENNNYIAWKFY